MASELPQNPHAIDFGEMKFASKDIAIASSTKSIILSKPGASFTFEFTGTELKLWTASSKRNLDLKVTVDGKVVMSGEVYNGTEKDMILPIASDLAKGKHTVKVEAIESKGTYFQLFRLMISGGGLEGIRIIG